MSFFPRDFESANSLKNHESYPQGTIFAIISCQRVVGNVSITTKSLRIAACSGINNINDIRSMQYKLSIIPKPGDTGESQIRKLFKNQKNPRAHKNKIGTSPPPPPNLKYPPPPHKTRNFMDMGFPAERTHFFPGVHKIGAAISVPRIADTNFTDTRIFLKKIS